MKNNLKLQIYPNAPKTFVRFVNSDIIWRSELYLMKHRLFQEFKNKPRAEIGQELDKLEEHLHALKFDLTMGKVKNIREIRDIKKSIAQLKTLLV